MVLLEKFLSCIQENVARINGYESGHDGSDGKSDCIGLIIGALVLAGFRWTGTHGSNWTVRNAMSSFGPISSAREMFLGEIVYKAREPGDAKYDLPSHYKDGGDLRDYYHVGVVTSIDPLCITHCTSVEGGIKRDSTQGAWKWGGRLKYIDYDEGGGDADEWAIVYAENGKTVNLRKAPNMKCEVIDRITVGTRVRVMAYNPESEWCKIETNGKVGYMMAEYLRLENVDEDEENVDEDEETVTVYRKTIEEIASMLEETVSKIRSELL